MFKDAILFTYLSNQNSTRAGAVLLITPGLAHSKYLFNKQIFIEQMENNAKV
jgi:hypothetical protein